MTGNERRCRVASPVLDSFALLVFLFEEKGHQKIIDVFNTAADDDTTTLIAAPNWAEVRYIVQRKVGLERWSEVCPTILALPLKVAPADQTLAEAAGALKATKKMSLADCFAAALAQQQRSPVYTGAPEFKVVEKEVEVIWL